MRINKKLLGSLLFHLTLMILAFSGLVFVFFEWALPRITKHGQSITVPNLKGIHVEALDEFLTRRNLRFKITDDVAYSPVYPPSVVLEQHPKAGAQVKEGRRIYLTINASQPPEVSMPNLVDGSVRNAQVILKSKGLSYGEIKYVPDIAKNAVLEQYYQGQPIAPGTRIAQGSQIDLIVGAGLSKQLLKVPDLVGKRLEEAELLLLDVGIQMGKVVYPSGDSQSSGVVSEQLPKAGTKVRWGTAVDLWLIESNQVTLDPELDQPITNTTE
jgi:eukaryotic-like serine/threonine-protein kinase